MLAVLRVGDDVRRAAIALRPDISPDAIAYIVESLPLTINVLLFENPYVNFTAEQYQALYARFCQAIGRPDLIDDSRFVTNPERVRHRAELGAILDQVLGALTVAELHERLVAAGVPSSPVNDLADVFADPQVRHRGLEVRLEDALMGEVRMVGGPLLGPDKLADCSRPPDLGEHSREILSGLLGLSEAEIDALAEKGVV